MELEKKEIKMQEPTYLFAVNTEVAERKFVVAFHEGEVANK